MYLEQLFDPRRKGLPPLVLVGRWACPINAALTYGNAFRVSRPVTLSKLKVDRYI